MTQSNNRFLDEMARLMTDAAGVAQGVRDEASTFFRGQAERVMNNMDVVQRDEFEAVRLMAEKARKESAVLEKRIAVLEAALETIGAGKPKAGAKTAPKSASKSVRMTTAKIAARKPVAQKTATGKTASGKAASGKTAKPKA